MPKDWIAPEKRGHRRVTCDDPCDLFFEGTRRQARLGNVSVVGIYVALPEPLPPLDGRVVVTFALPGDRAPIACVGRVRWCNEPSAYKGSGSTKPSLPPGCGIEFVALGANDRDYIAQRVDCWPIRTRRPAGSG
jgi:PilZ domain-containing protein